MDATLRLLRIIRLALLFAVLFYVLLGEMVLRPEPRNVWMLLAIMVVLAANMGPVILFVRRRFIQRSEEILRIEPENAAELGRWRTGHIVVFCIGEAVALYGFALRTMGGTSLQAAPFYVAGLIVLLASTPRRPE